MKHLSVKFAPTVRCTWSKVNEYMINQLFPNWKGKLRIRPLNIVA